MFYCRSLYIVPVWWVLLSTALHCHTLVSFVVRPRYIVPLWWVLLSIALYRPSLVSFIVDRVISSQFGEFYCRSRYIVPVQWWVFYCRSRCRPFLVSILLSSIALSPGPILVFILLSSIALSPVFDEHFIVDRSRSSLFGDRFIVNRVIVPSWWIFYFQSRHRRTW